MENIIKDIISLIEKFQGIIGVLFGLWIGSMRFKKELKQKDRVTENERIDKYRLSAINERLGAHQKAFEIWYHLSLAIHADTETQMKLSDEARQFWITHCLYLTPKCRKVFDELIFEFGMYKMNREIWFETKDMQEKKRTSDELVEKFNKIMMVGKTIQEEVDISYTEPEPISKLKEEENRNLEV